MAAGSDEGEFYVITTGDLSGATFADIDAAYAGGGTPVAVSTTIAAAGFTLVGANLPQVRNIIVLHEEDGVQAYQVIRITFNVATTG